MIRLEAEWIEWADDGSLNHWHHSADWWMNFESHLMENRLDDAEALAEWGAEYHWDLTNDHRYLLFEDEKMATLFLLRWA